MNLHSILASILDPGDIRDLLERLARKEFESRVAREAAQHFGRTLTKSLDAVVYAEGAPVELREVAARGMAHYAATELEQVAGLLRQYPAVAAAEERGEVTKEVRKQAQDGIRAALGRVMAALGGEE